MYLSSPDSSHHLWVVFFKLESSVVLQVPYRADENDGDMIVNESSIAMMVLFMLFFSLTVEFYIAEIQNQNKKKEPPND